MKKSLAVSLFGIALGSLFYSPLVGYSEENEHTPPKKEEADQGNNKSAQPPTRFFNYVVVGSNAFALDTVNGLISEGKTILVVSEPEFPLSAEWLESHPSVQVLESKDVTKLIPFVTPSFVVSYDRLLLVTGVTPKPLDFSAPEYSSRVTSRLVDGVLEKEKVKHITVIGDGRVGSGLVNELSKNGYDVVHVAPHGIMGKYFPPYLVQEVTQNFEGIGVKFFNSKAVEIREINNGPLLVVLEDGTQFKTDFAVSCIGTTLNNTLAKDSNFELDDTNGAIVVNSQLAVTDKIYAAGPAVSHYDILYAKRTRLVNLDNILESIRVAIKNIKNPADQEYFRWRGSPIFSISFGEDEYLGLGRIDSTLETAGVWMKGNSTLNILPLLEELNKSNPVQVNNDETNEPQVEESDADNDTQDSLHDLLEAESKREQIEQYIEMELKRTQTFWEEYSKTLDNSYQRNNLYKQGLVYYLKNDQIVGVLLKNMNDFQVDAEVTLRKFTEVADRSRIQRRIPFIQPRGPEEKKQ